MSHHAEMCSRECSFVVQKFVAWASHVGKKLVGLKLEPVHHLFSQNKPGSIFISP